MTNDKTLGSARASRARFGARAETLCGRINKQSSCLTPTCDREGALACTRGACAPQHKHVRHSGFVIPSSFVIRASSFQI